jgi:hypothetical protein
MPKYGEAHNHCCTSSNPLTNIPLKCPLGLSTVHRMSRMYSTTIWYRLPYQWTFGIVTTIASIRPVVNHILPYFDGHLQLSDGSQILKIILCKLLCTNIFMHAKLTMCVCCPLGEKLWSFSGIRGKQLYGYATWLRLHMMPLSSKFHRRQEPFLVARKTYTKPSTFDKYVIKLVSTTNPITNSKFAEQYATNNKANQIFWV